MKIHFQWSGKLDCEEYVEKFKLRLDLQEYVQIGYKRTIMSSLKCFSGFWYSSLCSVSGVSYVKRSANECVCWEWIKILSLQRPWLRSSFFPSQPQPLKMQQKAIPFVFSPRWCSALHALRMARERPRGLPRRN